ncbi:SulP family inorganic anion transporter [Roseococcus pinisoli]|uniref:SulP family inorganic anion transporter n=1 Tax=Roseococcus pinisoli TaxID=2835040 RepID=A0ABS5QGZ3_9PROT|nr:SulP family inorganic anion transporter [Roseococcus pinisoli]MBS7812225.1 SulP family inorganic anion transporter [Roseococcus pinisoli]
MKLNSLSWLGDVSARTLRADLVAGLMLAAYMVPAALADAALVGLPPQAGLNACIFAGLVFWLFSGPGRTVVTVTTGLSLLLGQTVGEISGGDPARHAALIATATLWAAVFAGAAWALGAGALARFVPETVMIGFKAGLALHLAAAQLPKLLGFRGHGEDFFDRITHLLTHLGDTQPWAFLLGLAALALLLTGKALAPKVPMALLVIVLGIGLGALLDVGAHGVAVVGEVPQGLPMPGLPSVSREEVRAMLPIGLACFLLAIVETSAIGRMFARRDGRRHEAGRDMLALAAANLAAGLGRGFAVGGGGSQSVVNDGAGARTPLSGLFGALTLVVVALFLTGLLAPLPQPVLAAIVLAAVTGLVDVAAFRRAWRFRRSEGMVAIASLAGVLAAGLLQGVLLGAALSLVLILRAALAPQVVELGQLPEGPIVDRSRYPEASPWPEAVVIACRSAILYMNAEHVLDAVVARMAGLPVSGGRVVLAMGGVNRIDLAGAEMMIELQEMLHAGGRKLVLAELRDGVARTLMDAGFSEEAAELSPHRSIEDALAE